MKTIAIRSAALFFFWVSTLYTPAALAAPIQISNHFSFFGDSYQNIILELDKSNMKGSGDLSWLQAVSNSFPSQ